MPAGCDFICQNYLCEHEGKFIVLTSPWPMGNIGCVIESLENENHPSLVQTLKEKEKLGTKYACIQLPNEKKVETLAYRLNFWHPIQKIVCEYHLELKGRTLEEALKGPTVPVFCPESKEKLISFNEILGQEIECPHCDVIMNQIRWFTNE